MQLFIKAVLAGFSIGLGGTAFLRIKDMIPGGIIVGSVFFAIGLLVVCTHGFALYTGKACYALDNKLSYLKDLAIIWLGNFIGAIILGLIENCTNICGSNGINIAANSLVQAKLDSSYLSLFWLGFLCNIFIYIAVRSYSKNPHELGKYLAILLGVSCFIISGTEHSVADMYYFAVSGVVYTKPIETLLVLTVVTMGNFFGGIFFPYLEKNMEELSHMIVKDKNKHKI